MNGILKDIRTTDISGMNGKVRLFLFLAVFGFVAVLVYGGPLYETLSRVVGRDDASHGVCIPFIAGYLFWLKFDGLKKLQPSYAVVPGLALVGIGLFPFLILRDSVDIQVPALSFLVVTAGLVIAFFGKAIFKELAFPLFYLAAMIPIPKAVYAFLTEGMRMATTWGSVSLLKVLQFPIYQEGYNIKIPNMGLFVANSCSGIRYLIPYFVFGLAYAYVCKKSWKARILVVLATVPIAIIGGILRQSFIFTSAHYIGPFMAEHTPHVMISWSVFVTVLVSAMMIDRSISKRFSRRPTPTDTDSFCSPQRRKGR